MESDAAASRIRRAPPAFVHAVVQSATDRSPRLRRVVLAGPGLAALAAAGPATSVRVLLPDDDGALVMPTWTGNEFLLPSGERPVIRTLTPQPGDLGDDSLAVDVVLHADGPAVRWARGVRPGDAVAVSGPGRVDPLERDARSYLLGGDESALPAIEQILAWLSPTTEVDVLIEVAEPSAVIDLPSHPRAHVTWIVTEPGVPAGHMLPPTVEALAALPERIWLAGEAAAIQRLRRHLFEDRAVARTAVVARGYWKHPR